MRPPGAPRARARGSRGVPLSDAASFEAFFEAESRALYRRLCLVLRDPPQAEDIMQETFVRIWERWERVRGMQDPVGYLYRVALRRATRARTSALRRPAALPPPSTPDEAAAADARLDAWQLLGTLSTRQRAALVLTELLGYSSEEAGRILGVRAGTARMLASQGRAALRRMAGGTDA